MEDQEAVEQFLSAVVRLAAAELARDPQLVQSEQFYRLVAAAGEYVQELVARNPDVAASSLYQDYRAAVAPLYQVLRGRKEG